MSLQREQAHWKGDEIRGPRASGSAELKGGDGRSFGKAKEGCIKRKERARRGENERRSMDGGVVEN